MRIISLNPSMKDLLKIVLAQIVCDVAYDPNLRSGGIVALEKIKAINLHVLKNWVTNKSPELLPSDVKDMFKIMNINTIHVLKQYF